jgi:predicted phosphodiesterase
MIKTIIFTILFISSFALASNLRISVISDINDSYGSTTYSKDLHKVINDINAEDPDLLLIAGDMVAGQKKSLTLNQIRAMWSGFDKFVNSKINVPLEFTFGNHDASSTKKSDGSYYYKNDRIAAKEYFSSVEHHPSVELLNTTNFPFYYSFKMENIYFLSIEASSYYIDKSHLAWIKEQLESEDSKNASKRIVVGHLPLYAVAQGRNSSGNIIYNNQPVLDIFQKTNVDLFISGHHHAYYPACVGKLKLLHAGAIGGGPRKLLGSSKPAVKTMTTVSIDSETDSITFDTVNIRTGKKIKLNELPINITGVNGTVSRIDRCSN